MAAVPKQLVVEAGATFFYPFVWKQPLVVNGAVQYQTDPTTGLQVPQAGEPVNLAGFTAKMQVRRNIADAEVLITLEDAMIASVDDIDFTVSAIYIIPSDGYVAIVISDTDTEALSSGVYDLEMLSAGAFRYRVFKGKVRVDGDVTRD